MNNENVWSFTASACLKTKSRKTKVEGGRGGGQWYGRTTLALTEPKIFGVICPQSRDSAISGKTLNDCTSMSCDAFCTNHRWCTSFSSRMRRVSSKIERHIQKGDGLVNHISAFIRHPCFSDFAWSVIVAVISDQPTVDERFLHRGKPHHSLAYVTNQLGISLKVDPIGNQKEFITSQMDGDISDL